MGYRLSKIYTRTGDDGTTGLGNGTRVSKDDPRIEVNGTLDELNSLIGLVLTEPMPTDVRELLVNVQHALFDLGGEVCVPGREVLSEASVRQLEQELDRLNAALAPLKEFILPGGCRAAALTHVARAVARRAERRLSSLASMGQVNPVTIKYLNRLSDLLFVTARYLNAQAGHPEPLWEPARKRR